MLQEVVNTLNVKIQTICKGTYFFVVGGKGTLRKTFNFRTRIAVSEAIRDVIVVASKVGNTKIQENSKKVVTQKIL